MAALRRALLSAGFTFERVRDVLGADESLTVAPHQVPMANRRLGDGPLGTLTRLFLLGAPVSQEQAARALAPLSVSDAVSIGVVAMGRSRVHGAVRILPANDGFFASDLDSIDPTDLPADFVMGVTDSSRLLAALTLRQPVESALDIGTGCGYQAILAARHASHVVATDVNPRAVAFARFNALLNDAANIEVRVGDGFAPVEGETFDLLVCNPPFVISPDRAFTFRDSGLSGDRVSFDLVRTAPRFLREGGFAHVLVSWIHAPSDDQWALPLREWVAESGCDAWLLRKGSYDPLAYAVMWNQRLALANQMQAYVSAVDRWTHYFERLGIEALGYGAVWLRRRSSGAVRVRADELPEGGVAFDAAADILRLLLAEDRLASLSDAALQQCVVRVSDALRMDQTLRWRDGKFRIVDASVVRDHGLRQRADVDAALAALLAQADGTRSVSEVLAHTSQALRAEPTKFSTEALPAVRELLSHGFLELAD